MKLTTYKVNIINSNQTNFHIDNQGRRVRDRMVVGFTTT
jgi:hypothetical protein